MTLNKDQFGKGCICHEACRFLFRVILTSGTTRPCFHVIYLLTVWKKEMEARCFYKSIYEMMRALDGGDGYELYSVNRINPILSVL